VPPHLGTPLRSRCLGKFRAIETREGPLKEIYFCRFLGRTGIGPAAGDWAGAFDYSRAAAETGRLRRHCHDLHFCGCRWRVVDSGFSSALIQRQGITIEDTSSVFYFNIATALIMALLLGAAAPYIAAFYRMPILKPLTWLMAFNLFIGSFRSIQAVLLTKELNFRTQMKVTVVATVISGAAGIGLAWRGWGVWSLAVQSVVATIVSVLLFWIFSPGGRRSASGSPPCVPCFVTVRS